MSTAVALTVIIPGDTLTPMHRWSFLCIPFLFILFSCGQSDVLVLADDIWVTLLGSEKEISREIGRSGLKAEVAVLGIGEGESRSADIIEDSAQRIIVLGPVFSGNADALASRFPDRRFIALGTWDRENIFSIYRDRAEILEETGRRCAGWVAGNRGEKDTVAAVFLSGTKTREAEYRAFMEGWNSADCDCDIAVELLTEETGTEMLDAFLSVELLDRCALGIFFAGKFTSRAVEYCSSVSVPVVAPYMPGKRGSTADFAFILRESYINSVLEALRMLKNRSRGSEGTGMSAMLEVSLQAGTAGDIQ